MNEAHLSISPISTTTESVVAKTYTPPTILYELELETRAGSPLAPDGLDPLGLNGPIPLP